MKKTWLWTPVTLLAVAALSYALFVDLRPPPLAEGFLYGNGHIEATEVTISTEVGGRVVQSNLVEGVTVDSGMTLVRLDDADLRARLAEAQAQTRALAKVLPELQAQLDTWRHHLKTASKDLRRFRELWAANDIGQESLEKAENREREARGQVAALEARLEETEARRAAARQRVKFLQLQLAKTVIRAPIGGTVLVKGIEMGELAVPGRPVAVLADLSRLELKVYIRERDIGKVRLGAAARVRVDAFPDRYFEATVARVDQQAQFTPRDIHMPQERVRVVFGVTLVVANAQRYLKPGMPADAWIRTQDDVPWPQRLVVPS